MRSVSRRQFVQGVGVAGLGLLAGCGRLPWQAQEPAKPVRLGYLTSTGGSDSQIRNGEAFLLGMRDHGYIEGQSLLIERRSGSGRLNEVQPQELSAPVAELVALSVHVIFAAGGTIGSLSISAGQLLTRTEARLVLLVPAVGRARFRRSRRAVRVLLPVPNPQTSAIAALDASIQAEAHGWFRHCGYSLARST